MSLEAGEASTTDFLSGLDDEVLTEVFSWIGDGFYRTIAPTSRRIRAIYRRVGTSTSAEQLVKTVAGAELFCTEAKPISDFYVQVGPFQVFAFEPVGFVAYMAAKDGNVHMLEWVRDECYCNSWVDSTGPFTLAALKGHVHVLEWLVENECASEEYDSFNSAAFNGHLEVFVWARDNGYCEWRKRLESGDMAARGGQLELLQWLREHGCPWDAHTFTEAAGVGNLAVLQWLGENGCPWDADVCSAAAGSGHLEALKWLREHGCPWDDNTCLMAATGGHLETLKWVRASGCPWHADTVLAAAGLGHSHIAEWARKNGCPD